MAREIPFEKVRSIIAEHFGIKEEDISEETSLYNDLGVDSLGVISMGIRLQAKFNVKIPPAIAAEFRTVGDIYHQLKRIEAEED